ncbi:MAG: PBP1A family penicillin-binding protein [Bdellovibrionales bacterium]|nr:PBP1A family penicillin-binding protein [Bdellovibrionales bacterium]
MYNDSESVLRSFFRSFSVVVFAAAAGGILAGFIFLFSLWQGLPDVATLKDFRHSHSTEVYSADGAKIGEYTVERRYPVKFEDIPINVKRAFIAAEDSNFYEHGGIDFVGIARAMLTNVMAGEYAQGASTITQQVARSILLATRKKELTRKIREMILARQMEKALSKDEILSLYMSEIYLGHGAYGIGAAARNYFQKEVQDLELAEAAVLAGLPQRPAEWDPFRNPGKCKQRQRYVLKRMVDEGYINQGDAEEAYARPLKLYPLKKLYRASPYFTEYVRTYLMGKYGDENVLREGYKVNTTVRYDFQQLAEKALEKGLREVDKRIGWRGPIKHLDGEEAQKKFLDEVHDTVMLEVGSARILPAVISNDERLPYDLTLAEDPTSPYFGKTLIKQESYYDALIQRVSDDHQMAYAIVGETPIEMPFDGMKWVTINERPIRSISQILVAGDVVQVRVDSIDKTTGKVLASLEQQPEVQGALLSYEIDTGFVVAMVGGTDFAKSQFNRAIQAKRQVGSTFKPLVYAAAFDKGFSPSSIVTDSPVVFRQDQADMSVQENQDAVVEEGASAADDWKPHNYGGKFKGEIPLRTALIRSMNVPTIKLLNEIGVDYAIQYARTLGITSPLPRDLTIALGSWSTSLEELMQAYAIFPRLGKPASLVYIERVTDTGGNILEEYDLKKTSSPLQNVDLAGEDPERSPPDDGLVISPQTAYVMTDMLKGVVTEGTGRRAHIAPNIAGKTGTSNDFHDAWFIGYSPHVMTGVWVGFDDQKPMAYGEGGGKSAAPIFAEYMKYVVEQYPKVDFPVPDDIVFAYVDRKTGYLATSSSEDRVRVAFKGNAVPRSDGSNVPRVSEPGIQRVTTGNEQTNETPNDENAAVTPSPRPEEDMSQLLRDGYE